MSLCFRSFSEGDAEDYHGSVDATEHYNRGYYDGQEDARKENEGNLDKVYRKGFEAGRSKAVAELMKKLFELFGDDVDLAYLDVKTEKWKNEIHYQQSNDDDANLEPELADNIEESSSDDSLDDKILKYVDSENAAINGIIHNEFSSYGSITLKDKEEDK